ncbi:nuclear envelope integral membrane protein 1 isoform X3 [Numida meleagris]|uniref:nuclear envelope integral membrane protein 1 isoform X3 n=1 Tax=Numida meleagris TaxID=8996 RepID=UPI000B3DD267|nr:nuclear envelope integral membrane protein 1 isoform X3 [Numida meleagris]
MAGGMKAVPGRWRVPGAVLLLLLFLLSFPLGGAGVREVVTPLQEGSACCRNTSHQFCYTNVRSPCWGDIWTRMQIRVNSNHVIRVTQVGSEEELRELEESKVWNFLSSFLKEKLNSTNIDVDLYSNKTCLKVELLESGTKYCIVLSRWFDPKLFLVFFLGLLLFFCGDMLSRGCCQRTCLCTDIIPQAVKYLVHVCDLRRSQLFFYSAGISIGLLASLLILVYVMSKAMPKKSPVYFLLVGGWSFSLYLLQLVFRNLQEICKSYWQYLLGYLLLMGFVSFGVCYRSAPSP